MIVILTEKKKRISEGKGVGLTTAFPTIDGRCGFRPGELVVLAARPSCREVLASLKDSTLSC